MKGENTVKLKNIHADVWIGLILIGLSIVFYMMSGSFANLDAATWPRVIRIGIMILSTLLVLHGGQLTKQNVDTTLPSMNTLAGAMAALVIMIICAILMNFTGYFVSTAIFLPVGMFLLRQQNWKAILGVTVGLEVFVYVLFVMQLQLRMLG